MVNAAGISADIAGRGDPPYVKWAPRMAFSIKQARSAIERCSDRDNMPVSAQTSTIPWPALVLSLAAGVLMAATIGLWAYFGSAVFFEMVRAGLAACF